MTFGYVIFKYQNLISLRLAAGGRKLVLTVKEELDTFFNLEETIFLVYLNLSTVDFGLEPAATLELMDFALTISLVVPLETVSLKTIVSV